MPDEAGELDVLVHVYLTPADEADAATAFGSGFVIELEPAFETNEAFDLALPAHVFLTPAVETDIAEEIRQPTRREVLLMALIDARPAHADIAFTRGDRFDFPLTVKDKETGALIDVSLWGLQAQVRAKRTSAVLAEFAVNDVDAANGFVLLTLSEALTRSLSDNKYVWDVARTDTARTLIKGNVFPDGDVTRDA